MFSKIALRIVLLSSCLIYTASAFAELVVVDNTSTAVIPVGTTSFILTGQFQDTCQVHSCAVYFYPEFGPTMATIGLATAQGTNAIVADAQLPVVDANGGAIVAILNIVHKDGAQFGTRVISDIPLGFVGFITSISPTAGSAVGGNTLQISGEAFSGTTFFCRFAAPDLPEAVATASVVTSPTTMSCAVPGWYNRADTVNVAILKSVNVTYPVIGTPLQYTFDSSWSGFPTPVADPNAASVRVIEGLALDVRAHLVTNSLSTSLYTVWFEMGMHRQEVVALPLSSRQLLVVPPTWQQTPISLSTRLLKSGVAVAPLGTGPSAPFALTDWCRHVAVDEVQTLVVISEANPGFNLTIEAPLTGNVTQPLLQGSVTISRPLPGTVAPPNETLTMDLGTITAASLQAALNTLSGVGNVTVERHVLSGSGVLGYLYILRFKGSQQEVRYHGVPLSVTANITSPKYSVLAPVVTVMILQQGISSSTLRCSSCPPTATSGDGHGCAVQAADGSPICWGLPPSQYINAEERVPFGAKQSPSTLISAGKSHRCTVRDRYIGSCWGVQRPALKDKQGVPPLPLIQISSGATHSCGISTTGYVVCWGDNMFGKAHPPFATCQKMALVIRQYYPVCTSPHKYVQVSAGVSHTCAVDAANGDAVCWGFGEDGQLGPWEMQAGVDSEGGRRRLTALTPVGRVKGPFSSVHVGVVHSCGLTTDGRVLCWGNNINTQCCLNETLRFRALAVGKFHACAIRDDTMEIYCWGRERQGQTRAPAGQFSQVTAGDTHSCGVVVQATGYKKGAVLCWGEFPLAKNFSSAPGSLTGVWENGAEVLTENSCEVATVPRPPSATNCSAATAKGDASGCPLATPGPCSSAPTTLRSKNVVMALISGPGSSVLAWSDQTEGFHVALGCGIALMLGVFAFVFSPSDFKESTNSSDTTLIPGNKGLYKSAFALVQVSPNAHGRRVGHGFTLLYSSPAHVLYLVHVNDVVGDYVNVTWCSRQEGSVTRFVETTDKEDILVEDVMCYGLDVGSSVIRSAGGGKEIRLELFTDLADLEEIFYYASSRGKKRRRGANREPILGRARLRQVMATASEEDGGEGI